MRPQIVDSAIRFVARHPANNPLNPQGTVSLVGVTRHKMTKLILTKAANTSDLTLGGNFAAWVAGRDAFTLKVTVGTVVSVDAPNAGWFDVDGRCDLCHGADAGSVH